MKQVSIAHRQVDKGKSTFFAGPHARRETFFQPKLTIGSTNDVYEKEADAMAEKVTGPAVQRTGAECHEGEDKKIQQGLSSSQTSKSIPLVHLANTPGHIQRAVEVQPNVELDTMGFHVSKSGNLYSSDRLTRSSAWNEIISGLFYSPRTFVVTGATTSEANKNFKAHLKARWDIIQFAARKKYRFEGGAAIDLNDAYWVQKGDNINVKPGIDQYKAMEDLNLQPGKYAIGCEAAAKFTMMGGSKSELRSHYKTPDHEWIPGDMGYIKNVNFPPTGGTPGHEGENIIYVGQNLYWGHISQENTYKTLEQWMALVNSWNNDGAVIQDWRTFPITGLDV